MEARAITCFCPARRSPGRFAAPRLAFLSLLIAGILAALATTAYALSFSDVPANHPYVAAISDLASREVINGLPDGTFQPDRAVTRQHFAKMIVKTLGLHVSAADADPFTDVPTGLDAADPFYPDKYVAVCYERGLTEAKTPTTFAPFDNLSRAQLITFVARAANLPDPPAAYDPPFGNFSPDHYSWARKAAYAGLLDGLQGMGPGFDFLQNASRGECAQVLRNLLLLTQPKSAGTTLSPSGALPVAQVDAGIWAHPSPAGLAPGLLQYQTFSGGLSAGAAAAQGGLLRVQRILSNPYAITGICVVVLAVLAVVVLVVGRSRSARRQSPNPARPIGRSTAQEDAQALLDTWAKEKAVPPLPWELENRTIGADDASPLASPAPLRRAKSSMDDILWNELVESALDAQAAKGVSAHARLAPGGSEVGRAGTK